MVKHNVIALCLFLSVALSGCVSVESLDESSWGLETTVKKTTIVAAKRPVVYVSKKKEEPVLRKTPRKALVTKSAPKVKPTQSFFERIKARFKEEAPKKTAVRTASKKDSPKKGLTRIDRVKLGMTHNEVVGTMGRHVTIGYEQSEYLKGAYKPITLDNPYRSEVFKSNGRVYNIAYYFTRINKEDGMISNDELMPLIFENRMLIGMGWGFLKAIKGDRG